MSPQAAQRTAQHARRLLTCRMITPHDYAVLDALLWRCRRPGRADLIVSYASVARLAGVCRDVAIGAVRKLVGLGMIAKVRRRVRVAWGRGCIASRQVANGYVFSAPNTESTGSAADKGIEIKKGYQRPTGAPQPPVRSVEEQIRMLTGG